MITKVEAETDREYVDLENVLQDTWEGDIQKNESEVYPVTVTAYSDSGMTSSEKKTFDFSMETGYISNSISGEDGSFQENPIITLNLEAKYKCFGLKIKFSGNLPKKFLIQSYADNVLNDTVTIDSNITKNFEFPYEFTEFDKMELEFLETEVPNNRIQIDYISFGAETDYTVEYDDQYNTPTGTQLDKIKNLNVSRNIYTQPQTAEELTSDTFIYEGENIIYYFNDPCYGYIVNITQGPGAASIVSSGAYYIEISISNAPNGSEIQISITGYKYNVTEAIYTSAINNRGTDTGWNNPLISDYEHCKDVAEWLADYYAAGVEYELDYRGEPALDAGDTIFQENKYVENLKVVVEEVQQTYNGKIGGALRTRRKERVDRAINGLGCRRLF